MARSSLVFAAVATTLLPDREIKSVQSVVKHSKFYDSTVLVDTDNNKLLIKISNDADGKIELQKETAILLNLNKYLADKPFTIPNIVESKELDEDFIVIYDLPQGRYFKENNIGEVRLTALIQALKEIHTLDKNAVLGISLPVYSPKDCRDSYIDEFNRLKKYAVLDMQIEKRFEEFLINDDYWEFAPKPIHGNALFENFLFVNDIVHTVLDWNNLKIADPAYDLSMVLCAFPQEVCDDVLNTYRLLYVNELNDPFIEKRVRFYGEFQIAHYLLQGLESGNRAIIDDAQNMILQLKDLLNEESKFAQTETQYNIAKLQDNLSTQILKAEGISEAVKNSDSKEEPDSGAYGSDAEADSKKSGKAASKTSAVAESETTSMKVVDVEPKKAKGKDKSGEKAENKESGELSSIEEKASEVKEAGETQTDDADEIEAGEAETDDADKIEAGEAETDKADKIEAGEAETDEAGAGKANETEVSDASEPQVNAEETSEDYTFVEQERTDVVVNAVSEDERFYTEQPGNSEATETPVDKMEKAGKTVFESTKDLGKNAGYKIKGFFVDLKEKLSAGKEQTIEEDIPFEDIDEIEKTSVRIDTVQAETDIAQTETDIAQTETNIEEHKEQIESEDEEGENAVPKADKKSKFAELKNTIIEGYDSIVKEYKNEKREDEEFRSDVDRRISDAEEQIKREKESEKIAKQQEKQEKLQEDLGLQGTTAIRTISHKLYDEKIDPPSGTINIPEAEIKKIADEDLLLEQKESRFSKSENEIKGDLDNSIKTINEDITEDSIDKLISGEDE